MLPCYIAAQAVNFYGKLVSRRHEDRHGPKRMHWFNSFLYESLMQHGNALSCQQVFNYGNVRRWTRQKGFAAVNLFIMDKVIFPVNIGNVSPVMPPHTQTRYIALEVCMFCRLTGL